MGNILSGSRGGRGGKPILEHYPKAQLTLATIFSLRVHNGPAVRPEGHDWATVVHGQKKWQVGLAYTPLHFGGHKRWLVCSVCGCRRQALFVDDLRLACRVCLGLRHSSNHEDRRSRLIRRANKIRHRLGWEAGALRGPGRKPARMHWTTYWHLTAELEALTSRLVGDLSKWVSRAELLFG
jgi:hypothetical protein